MTFQDHIREIHFSIADKHPDKIDLIKKLKATLGLELDKEEMFKKYKNDKSADQ